MSFKETQYLSDALRINTVCSVLFLFYIYIYVIASRFTQTLKELYLGWSRIGNEGIRYLAEALKKQRR